MRWAGEARRSSTGRGRPPKGWIEHVASRLEEFRQSTATDPLWFGVEKKTLRRALKQESKQITDRVKAASDVEETKQLLESHQRFEVPITVLETIHVHGSDSKEFKEAFDFAEHGGTKREQDARCDACCAR